MNYINCKNTISSDEMRKAIAFWSENTFQHIDSLLTSSRDTEAILNSGFREQLTALSVSFKKINSLYRNATDKSLPPKPETFFKENQKFINLLERLKFEGYNGYPSLQQTIFHYLYEQRYADAIFSVSSGSANVIVTTKFNCGGNYPYICIYNQMYFWSIIGAMHPSLLTQNAKFHQSLIPAAAEHLIEITNQFNRLNSELSCIERPITKLSLRKPFEKFEMLNSIILNFLYQAKSNSSKVYAPPFAAGLSKSFYGTLQHMIDEHTLVKELNSTISQKLS